MAWIVCSESMLENERRAGGGGMFWELHRGAQETGQSKGGSTRFECGLFALRSDRWSGGGAQKESATLGRARLNGLVNAEEGQSVDALIKRESSVLGTAATALLLCGRQRHEGVRVKRPRVPKSCAVDRFEQRLGLVRVLESGPRMLGVFRVDGGCGWGDGG